jgi:hypothetical protein
MDAPIAWNYTTGGVTPAGDTIVIAVVDAGFSATHPDLQPNHWKNTADSPGDGIDNDGNGLRMITEGGMLFHKMMIFKEMRRYMAMEWLVSSEQPATTLRVFQE